MKGREGSGDRLRGFVSLSIQIATPKEFPVAPPFCRFCAANINSRVGADRPDGSAGTDKPKTKGECRPCAAASDQ